MLGLLLIGRPTRPTPPVCCRPSQEPFSPLDTPLDTLEGIIRFGIPVVAAEGGSADCVSLAPSMASRMRISTEGA
jgi:hypothetical protein